MGPIRHEGSLPQPLAQWSCARPEPLPPSPPHADGRRGRGARFGRGGRRSRRSSGCAPRVSAQGLKWRQIAVQVGLPAGTSAPPSGRKPAAVFINRHRWSARKRACPSRGMKGGARGWRASTLWGLDPTASLLAIDPLSWGSPSKRSLPGSARALRPDHRRGGGDRVYVGIDAHKRECHATVLNEKGEKLSTARFPTNLGALTAWARALP